MSRAEKALLILTVAGLVVIPVVFVQGVFDYFRPIKEIAFRAQAILMVFALAAAITAGGQRLRELFRARMAIAVIAGAVLWTIITTITSTNRLLSVESLVTTICAAALFVCVWYASRWMPPAALLVLVPVAVVNAALVTMQEYGIWNPFQFTIISEGHFTATGLIGNPNDVGAYLAFVALILFALAVHTRGWQRIAAAAGSMIAAGGVFVSLTRAAVIALVAGLFVFGLRRSRKLGLAIVLAFLAALAIASWVNVPGLTRLTRIPARIAQGQWGRVLSYRLSPFVAAAEMFFDRPAIGQGPGTYKFHEMPYRADIADRYTAIESVGVNFGETHNDHLQLLAENGVPGYALFLAALVLIAGTWSARAGPGDRARFAGSIGWPLAVAIFVLCLASFPLQIAVTRHLLLTVAALSIGWRET